MSVITKFLKATTTRGERIAAQDADDSRLRVVIPYSYRHDAYEAHARAVYALYDELGWDFPRSGFVGVNYGPGYAWTAADAPAVVQPEDVDYD